MGVSSGAPDLALLSKQIGQMLAHAEDLREVARLVTGAARRRPEMAVALLMPADAGGPLELLAYEGDSPASDQAVVSSPDSPLVRWALETGEHLISPNLSEDIRLARSLAVSPAAAALFVIRRGPGRTGLLTVYHPQAGGPLVAEFERLAALAEVVSLRLEMWERHQGAQAQVRHLHGINEVVRLLTQGAASPERTLHLVADVAAWVFHLDFCAFRTGATVVAAPTVTPQGYDLGGVGGGDADSVACAPPNPDQIFPFDPGRVTVLPLKGRRSELGWLVASRRTPFGSLEVNLLLTWAALAGLALENLRLKADLERTSVAILAAVTDVLEAGNGLQQAPAAQVVDLVTATARQLGFSDRALRELEAAAYLRRLSGLLGHPPAVATHSAPEGLLRLDALLEQSSGLTSGRTLGSSEAAISAQILVACELMVAEMRHAPGTSPFAALHRLQRIGGAPWGNVVLQALEAVVWSRTPFAPELEGTPPEREVALAESVASPIEPEAEEQEGEPGAAALVLRDSDLTLRETEILQLVGRGLINREIAAHLHLSAATVKTHVSRVLQKLGLTDRTKAAVYALQRERTGR